MNKSKEKNYSFTPEELGLERLKIHGRYYIDVTPLWIDSQKSREIQAVIKEREAYPENRKGADRA